MRIVRFTSLVAVLVLVTAAPSFGNALRVGHRVEKLVVPGSALCPDPDVPCELENRKVKVHLWYPADQRGLSDLPKAVYTSALHRDAPGVAERWTAVADRWDPLTWTVEADIARETEAIDPHGKPFPVIVFSHGATNDPIDYAHTLELIAGEGFVVAAPYHVNNTQDDARIDFINGQASGVTPGLRLFGCDDGRPSPCSRTNVARSMEDRVRDISHILDALPGWFGDRVDVSRAGVMGHSRGTVTALAAAGGSLAPPIGWGFRPEPRVKAIMGLAIGVRPITFAANLAHVSVPAVLVAGGLDRNSAQVVSEDAFAAISSKDKLFVGIPNATHRSFDSTYCEQLQSAGAAFDLDHDGVVELSDLDTDGDEVVEPSDLASTRAILDLHTVRVIAASAPGGMSGKAVHYCASEFFTSPVDVRELVGALAGETASSEFSCSGEEVRVCAPVLGPSSVCRTTSIPCTGLDTEEVKEGVKEIAVAFFDTALKRDGNDGMHFTRYLAPNWLMKHVPMVGSAQAYAGPGSICPPDQGVICAE